MKKNYILIILLLMAGITFGETRQVVNTNDSGAGSLRQALNDALSGDTIVFSEGLYGDTIRLRSTLTIDRTVTLTINGFSVVLSGEDNVRILYIENDMANINLNRLHFTKGKGASHGGAIYNKGTLKVSSCIFSHNKGTYGAAVYSGGTLDLFGNTFYENTATLYGGALYAYSGSSALMGNLFFYNRAPAGGDVIFGQGVTSRGYNVYEGRTSGFIFNGPKDQLYTIPSFSSVNYWLADDSEAVQLLPGSQIPAGYPNADFYGNNIVSGSSSSFNSGAVQHVFQGTILVYEAQGDGDVVIIDGDQPDANGFYTKTSEVLLRANKSPEDSVRFAYWMVNGERLTDSRLDTLRVRMDSSKTVTAIFAVSRMVSNLNNDGEGSFLQVLTKSKDGDLVYFADNLSGDTLHLTSSLVLSNIIPSMLIDIDGNGVVLSGGDSLAILSIRSASFIVSLSRFHFTNANNRDGGAIFNYGKLNVSSCIFSHNKGFNGGAIFNSGTLDLSGNTFYNNSAENIGGALFNDGTSFLTANLFYDNHADNRGDVVYGKGVTSRGYNVYNGSSYDFSFDQQKDRLQETPSFSMVNYHLASDSKAVGIMPADSISDKYPLVDFYGNEIHGDRISAGAVQQVNEGVLLLSVTQGDGHLSILGSNQPDGNGFYQKNSELVIKAVSDNSVSQLYYWVVNGERLSTNTDTLRLTMDASKSLLAVFRSSRMVTNVNNDGVGSLRAILAAAINFDSIYFSETLSGDTVRLKSSLVIDNGIHLVINGNGVVLSGEDSLQILNISNSSADISLSRFHFTKGRVSNNGGAINNRSKLTVSSCIFSHNRTTSSSGYGGAIYNSGTLDLFGNTFYNNQVEYAGAVLFNNSAQCTLTGNLLFGNKSESSNGVIWHNGSGAVRSGGYNIYEGSSVNFTFGGTGDQLVQFPSFSPVNYHLALDSKAVGVISEDSIPAAYPAVDFYGNSMRDGRISAGAVQITEDKTLLRYEAKGLGTVSIIDGDQPDAQGFYAKADEVWLKAVASGANTEFLFWSVNGERQASGTDTLRVGMDASKHVIAVFRSHHMVTNLNNAGDGSFRSLLATAGDYDSIYFSESLSGDTLRLESSLRIDRPLTLTISGNGVVLSGEDNIQIMAITDFSADITLSRLHFTKGRRNSDGGAISNSAKLSVSSCIFSHNITTGYTNDGGAIYNSGNATLNLMGNTFYNNYTESNGGALFLAGKARLTGNLFYGNRAKNGGDVVYKYSSYDAASGGYNVYDGNSYSFNFDSIGDRQQEVQSFSSVGFELAVDSKAIGIIAADSIPEGYPTVDFYGASMHNGRVNAGAVQRVKEQVLLTYEVRGVGSLTVVGNNQPDAKGFCTKDEAIKLKATPGADRKLSYWIVNGNRQEASDTLTLPMNNSTVVSAVFGRSRTVTTVADDGAGSLRELLSTVENYDLISFSESLSGDTLHLRKVLTIGDGIELVINGNGVVVSGGDSVQILSVNNTLADITLSRFHFTRGRTTSQGGAIYNYGNKLTVSSCIFSHNSVISSGIGGAIYNSGTLDLFGNTFYDNNSQTTGGALYHSSSSRKATLTGNLFYGNRALNEDIIYSSSRSVVMAAYNVYEGRNNSFNFDTVNNRLQETLPCSPFSFSLVSDSKAVGFVPADSVSENYPAEDFYGNAMQGNRFNVGAVQEAKDGVVLACDVKGKGRLNIIGNNQPDADGFCIKNETIQLTATADSDAVFRYWIVNGERRDVTDTLRLPMDNHTFVTAIFARYRMVTNTNDDGEGSLRAMLSSAVDNDSIYFSESLSGDTLRLVSGLVINKSLSLNGNGVVISGEDRVRILNISDGFAEVSLNALHFTKGNNYSSGGAIYNDGKLSISSCIFSQNRTTNAISSGAAIFNRGRLDLFGNTFYDNISLGNGGAIYNYTGQTSLTANLFYGNRAGVNGDVVYGNGGFGVKVYSYGYNVYEGTSYQFSFDGLDVLMPDLSFDPTTFLPKSEYAEQIRLLPSDILLVNTDYYGIERSYPSVAGAVSGYEVWFDYAINSRKNLTYVLGGLLDEPSVSDTAGYIFVGWYKDLMYTEQWDFTTDVVDHHLVLYAKWQSASDAGLKYLSVDHGSLSPAFSASVTSYDVRVDSNVNEITITAFAAQDSAKVEGAGKHSLQPGGNVIDITVTAPDKVTKKVYRLNVNRFSSSIIPKEDRVLLVYPNPVAKNEPITIERTENTPRELVMYDFYGREVLRRRITDQKTTVTAPQSSGVYIIRITGESSFVKIIVK